jgi:hypothetical protein
MIDHNQLKIKQIRKTDVNEELNRIKENNDRISSSANQKNEIGRGNKITRF